MSTQESSSCSNDDMSQDLLAAFADVSCSQAQATHENQIVVEISTSEDLVKEIKVNKESSTKFKVLVKFYMSQEDLKQLAESNLGIHAEELLIIPEFGNGESPVLDFKEISFLKLESLTIRHQSIKAMHFTKENTPILCSLTIEQSCADMENIYMDLPELTEMEVDHITVQDSRGFGESLSRSPKLRFFNAYKFWGLSCQGNEQVLVLPNCEMLSLDRSDDLTHLEIWAPKLEDLDLEGCFSLTEVNILDDKPDGYPGPEYSFSGTPSQYEVNLINTDNMEDGNLTSHPRCKKVNREMSDVIPNFPGGIMTDDMW